MINFRKGWEIMLVSGFGSVNSYSYAYDKIANRISTSSDAETAQVSQSAQTAQAGQTSQANQIDQSVQTQESSSQELVGQEGSKAPRTANPQDFVFDFKQNNDYNLVAAKSKVEDVDVEKALSDMKKDSVLDQYKFFVKSSLVNNEDGTVRQVIRN